MRRRLFVDKQAGRPVLVPTTNARQHPADSSVVAARQDHESLPVGGFVPCLRRGEPVTNGVPDASVGATALLVDLTRNQPLWRLEKTGNRSWSRRPPTARLSPSVTGWGAPVYVVSASM